MFLLIVISLSSVLRPGWSSFFLHHRSKICMTAPMVVTATSVVAASISRVVAGQAWRHSRGFEPVTMDLLIDYPLFPEVLNEKAIWHPVTRSEAIIDDMVADMPHSAFEVVANVTAYLLALRIE